MLTIESKSGGVGDTITVAVNLDGMDIPLNGLSFDLQFDPAALTFVSAVNNYGTFIQSNLTSPGVLNVQMFQALEIDPSNVVCEVSFEVQAASLLTLTNVNGSSLDSQDFPMQGGQGEITISGGPVMPYDIRITWSDPNPSGVEAYLIYQGNNPSDLASFVEIASSPVGDGLSFVVNGVDPNQGDIYFAVQAIGGGKAAPLAISNAVNTNDLAAVTNVTAQII